MTKIYLIRHAEAEGNFYRRIQGHWDGNITERGHAQIDCLAERFRECEIDAVYASDLRRTQITAESILKYHNLPLNIEPRLKEVNMGAWENVPWGNVAYDQPEQLANFSVDPAKWDIPGCENFYDLRNRITEVILELGAKHQGQKIACFSHGMAIRSLISGIQGVASENLSEVAHGDNTCVACMTVTDGQIRLEYYNDNSHLPEALSTFANQSWWKANMSIDLANLRLLPMDIVRDSKIYSSCYRDAWRDAHGSLNGYADLPYLQTARLVSNNDPLTLIAAYRIDDFSGILELDPSRMKEDGAGWISFLYIIPELRGQNYAVQLIGQAVSYYRTLGRTKLRLHVAETNKRALGFYEKLHFRCIDTVNGAICPLKLLEKNI